MSQAMNIRLKVLVVSRLKSALDVVEAALSNQPGLELQRKLVVNGHVDPLQGVDTAPDALILHLGQTWQAELESLAARPVDRRPPLIVIGSASDTNIMRLAMQAGARDLLPLPLVEADLIAALARIERDHRAAGGVDQATLTAFINAKGGCGATLLASNVAHVLAAVSHKRVTLFDLDLQFGAIPLYFDLLPKRGILQALENVDGLDEVAFDGYLVKHGSGLKVLGHAAEDPLPIQPVSADRVRQLLDLAIRSNEHVVVDLPRRIDAIASLAFERARQIVLVVQQSVATLRDATRLMQCLRRDLLVSKDRIITVINRYEKDSPISLDDIRGTLSCGDIAVVPNDFRTVSECINTGTPLLTHARGSAISKAIMSLETRLGGSAATERPGLLQRTFSSFIKPRSV
jgi:pilus assembly protein CpaE